MRLAASTCREQQAIQHRIATDDPLENRRNIAEAAAKAWGKEAAEADKREAREAKRRAEIEAEKAIASPESGSAAG
jgi:hypothetical protein